MNMITTEAAGFAAGSPGTGSRMKNILSQIRLAIEDITSSRIGAGSWVILIVLLLLLAATGVLGFVGWNLGGTAAVSASGYIAMTLGVIFSLVVGFGLMALIFYSSRQGYDDPPVLIVAESDDEHAKDVPKAK
jgi:hypothetical protein